MASPTSGQMDPDLTDVSPDSHAGTAAELVSLDLSSPLSSIQGAAPSASSSGDPSPDRSPNKRPATAPATPQRSPKRTTTEPSSSGHSTPGFCPNVFDFELDDMDLLEPAKADASSTAVADFLATMDVLIATPPEKRRTPRQNLQSFLIQQQLLAGIPVDRLEPMSGPGSRQGAGPLQRFNTPTVLTVTRDATYIPHIPPAQFNGSLAPLPIHPSLPNPPWMDNENGDSHRDGGTSSGPVTHSQSSATSTGSPKVNDPQTPDNITGLSAYFSTVAEQVAVAQFYSAHFSTGSGLLQQPAAAPAIVPAAVPAAVPTAVNLGDDTENEGLISPLSRSGGDTETDL